MKLKIYIMSKEKFIPGLCDILKDLCSNLHMFCISNQSVCVSAFIQRTKQMIKLHKDQTLCSDYICR